jgi:alkylhydroperoxidase/carboxymuconolactone decarboxylase family protein YurZ
MAQASLPPFLARLAQHDAEFAELVADVRHRAVYTPGALDVKTKILIAFALDAARGLETGMRSLAARAREAGATDEELAEVLRVLYSVGGLQNLSHTVEVVFPTQG